MYVIFQGDRLLIGASQHFSQKAYTLSDLGIYSVAAGLSMLPISIVTGALSRPLLPFLAGVQTEFGRFVSRYRLSVQAICLVSGTLTLNAMLIGGAVLTLIYGDQYSSATQFYWILAASQGLRLIRVVPMIAGQAFADNRIYVIANLARVIGFPIALGVAMLGGSLVWFAAAGFAGEMLALCASVIAIKARYKIPVSSSFRPLVIVLGALTAAALTISLGRIAGLMAQIVSALALSTMFVFAILLTCSELREQASETLRDLKRSRNNFLRATPDQR